MRRSFMIIVLQLLFGGFASVRATQQNFTIDDTSPDIVYSAPTVQCNANTTTCPDGLPEGLFNKSVTLTSGSIKVSFTGIAFNVSFYLIGACTITLDSKQMEFLNVSLADILAHPDDGAQPEGSNIKDLANGPHTLVFTPVTNGTIIGFDHLSYTHVGAIVGGVIGAVVLTTGVLFAVLFARRRRLILRRNQRKSAVLRALSTASARPDYKAGAEADARPDYKMGADDGRGATLPM